MILLTRVDSPDQGRHEVATLVSLDGRSWLHDVPATPTPSLGSLPAEGIVVVTAYAIVPTCGPPERHARPAQAWRRAMIRDTALTGRWCGRERRELRTYDRSRY